MDQRMIVCWPAALELFPIPGSVRRLCSCDVVVVLVSAEMVKHVDSGEYVPVCIYCAPDRIEGRKAGVHPDQVERLRALGILDMVREWIK